MTVCRLEPTDLEPKELVEVAAAPVASEAAAGPQVAPVLLAKMELTSPCPRPPAALHPLRVRQLVHVQLPSFPLIRTQRNP